LHHAAHALAVDRWSSGVSPLHARDARAKFIALLVFLIAVSTTRPGAGIAFSLYAAIVIMAVFIAHLPFLALLKRAALILPFSATFALITWWSGEPARAAAFAEKSILSAFAALLLIATTPINDLLRALASLGVPRQLILVVQFLHRYLFVIAEQAQHMRLAAQCRRGFDQREFDQREFDQRGSPKRRRFRFQGAAGALGVLFARSWERADGIYRAMLARGFMGQFPRLSPAQFRFADAVFLLFSAVISVSIRLAV
jgi:cobalt/nickel transport system permease protein